MEPETSGNAIFIIYAFVTTTIGAILGGAFTLLNSKYKYKLEVKDKNKHRTSLKEVARFNFEIDKLLYELLAATNFDRITLCRYHNGEEFVKGLPIDKYTMTNEAISSRISETVNEKHQSIHLSKYSTMQHELLYKGCYLRNDIDSINDMVLREYCKKNNLKNTYLFLIEDIDKDPLGFVTFCSINSNATMTDVNEIVIRDKHDAFVNLVKATDKFI